MIVAAGFALMVVGVTVGVCVSALCGVGDQPNVVRAVAVRLVCAWLLGVWHGRFMASPHASQNGVFCQVAVASFF